jgi:hypothetical protein
LELFYLLKDSWNIQVLQQTCDNIYGIKEPLKLKAIIIRHLSHSSALMLCLGCCSSVKDLNEQIVAYCGID